MGILSKLLIIIGIVVVTTLVFKNLPQNVSKPIFLFQSQINLIASDQKTHLSNSIDRSRQHLVHSTVDPLLQIVSTKLTEVKDSLSNLSESLKK